MHSVCLAVLNYNGVNHLECLLPSLEAACRESPIPAYVLVLDNRSNRNDSEWIMRCHANVQCVVAPKNDYLFSYNWLLGQLEADIVILLNNDLRVQRDFVGPLLHHFKREDVFAVSATSRDWYDTVFTCGPARLQAHHGQYHWHYETQRQELAHTLFASGGFAAVDRRKFVELGGFNTLFRPGYGEDLDLCFRAWRRGWRCIFEPRSLVFHRENGSWGNRRTLNLIERNRLLFQWSSLPPAAPLWEDIAMQVWTGLRELHSGNLGWWPRRLATRLKWARHKRFHRHMKVSHAELKRIMQRLSESVADF
jgi:N-acetylglucosaminyl-diphospho-decaprenol L-rhamnosyltransferase